jgi:hypothetical protein
MYGQLVACGSGATSLSEERIRAAWPVPANSKIIAPAPGLLLARFTPIEVQPVDPFVWSDDRQVVVSVDGYFLLDSLDPSIPVLQHLRAFANLCRARGYQAALRTIVSGSFNLVVADLSRSTLYATKDHVGNFSFYHSPLDGGWLLSSNVVALAQTNLIDSRLDLTACAEWALVGYTIGERYMLKGIKRMIPYRSFAWDWNGSAGRFETNADTPWDILPDSVSPPVDEAIERFTESCRRASLVDPHPAHFQSAGWDSRAILAAWPDSYNPPCYTYGDPESHEVAIARAIAAERGSQWVHVWMNGDDVARGLRTIFDIAGHIIFPDRYFAARQMLRDGHHGALDGFLGGVLIGNGYYSCDRHFSALARLGRQATVFVEQKVSRIGLDLIADALFEDIQEVPDPATLRLYLSDDLAHTLAQERGAILQDIHDELARLRLPTDSLAVLWRNFFMANRSAHAIVQQAVLCRASVQVYCPFSADQEFHRLQLRIRPRDAAFHRYYREMYLKKWPRYANLPFGDSLMPIKVAPIRHRLSRMLISEGHHIPMLSGNAAGRERDANSWGAWFHQSDALRQCSLQFLRDAGVIDEARAGDTMRQIAAGNRKGNGKLLHLASVAQWISLANTSSRLITK